MTRKTRIKLSTALIAAMLSVLLLAGAALAASQSGLLARLFIDTPSEEAQRNVVEGGMSASDGGFTLTVEELLRNDDKLYYSLGLTAPDDAQYLIMMDYPEVSVPHVERTSAFSGGLNMKVIGKGYEQYGAPLTLLEHLRFYEGVPEDNFTVALECAVLTPASEVTAYTSDHEALANGEDVDWQWMTDGLRTCFANEVDLCASPDFWNLMRERKCANDFDACVALVEELGLASRIATIELTLELNMADFATAAGTRVDGQDTFEFDEYDLKVAVCDFNAVDAHLIVEVHPKRAMEEMTMDNDDPLWYHYQMLNADGTPIAYLSGGGGGGTRPTEDGTVIYVYELTMHGVNEVPDSVMLMPNRMTDRGPQPVEAEAVTVKLTAK